MQVKTLTHAGKLFPREASEIRRCTILCSLSNAGEYLCRPISRPKGQSKGAKLATNSGIRDTEVGQIFFAPVRFHHQPNAVFTLFRLPALPQVQFAELRKERSKSKFLIMRKPMPIPAQKSEAA